MILRAWAPRLPITAFSIAPLIIIVVAIAGFAFGEEAASGYLYGEISGLLGDEGGQAVQGMVNSASSSGKGLFATVIGVVLLVVGATTVFAELQTDLDRIWKAPAAMKSEGLWELLRSRVLSLGLVISIGFLMLVSLVVSAGLAALGEWWGGAFESVKWLLRILNFAVSFIVITVMFALMYKILPRVKIGWRDVWIGAAVTAPFTIGCLVASTRQGGPLRVLVRPDPGRPASGCTTRRRSFSAPNSHGNYGTAGS
jgi:membrane protein